jgi:LysM repeat protein
VIVAAFACAPLVLAACGGSTGGAADSGSTLQYVPTTNYVLQEPATTTTTTTTIASATPGEDERSPGEQTYVIQAGDGLFAIANSFDVEMQLICYYNGWTECGGDKLLLPGDEILIPPNAAVASADTGSADGDTEEDSIDTDDDGAGATEGEGCLHTVVEGDNQGRVANQYDVTLEELAAANASNPAWNHFQLGSTINIPANGTCPD